MPVTAQDIANELGLSQPTVSRILSGASGHRVSAKTRDRVLAAAQRMKYRPNAVAQSLRHGRTNIVGFYSSHGYLDTRNDFQAEIIGGLQQACDTHHLDLLLHGIFPGRSPEDIHAELCNGRIDGLLLHAPSDDAVVKHLAGASYVQPSLHVVAMTDPLANLPSVVCDDADGMRQLIDYLWQRGHRRIAFITTQMSLSSVKRREEAFRHLLRQRGLSPDEILVEKIEIEEAAPVLDALLSCARPPTAVCCWNDRTAYSFMEACRKRGVRVPDDFAVTGFDGFLDDKMPLCQLVTVASPHREVAATSMGVLIRGMNGEEVPLETTLPVRLSPGDTA
ncbi:MAG TPA: LacI family DNA-binding transcriptional regulator [Abditibacteriaceae bacterium]|jgi:DNA-binding LacI/PurR family transcriptional regulator